VSFAQRLHRIDIRLRLGLLQDTTAIERQVQREIAEAEARRARSAVTTVKTEAQVKFDAERLRKEIKEIEDKAKQLPRVRPLSENRAIETGANFISETFLFCVTGGIIVFEYWRQRRKEAERRDGVSDKLDVLDGRIERIERALGVEPLKELDKPALLALPATPQSALEKDPSEETKSSDSTQNSTRDAEGRIMLKEQNKKK
jgi:optic atrophy 3 protein